MASSFFGSPPFLSHPITRNHHFSTSSSSSSQTPTPPPSSSNPPPTVPPLNASAEQLPLPPKPTAAAISTKKAAAADSTDWIASSLTRRFGIGAGLSWAAFLAFGVVSEQIKTRFEVSQQQSNTRDVENEEEVLLPNGIRYYEMRVGGGATPRPGDLVVIDLKGNVQGSEEAFVDTFTGDKRPLALVVGSRPYSKGMCEGIEYVLRSMKAGGKRRVIIPSVLGFRENGADLGNGVLIPPNAPLEYILEVERVSIAPA